MEKPLKDRVLEDLLKTGFVKELQVAQMLTSVGWRTRLNETYQVKDTNLSREIDIVAAKRGTINYNKVDLWVNLVIECKQSVNPWVILTNDTTDSLSFYKTPGWGLIHGGEKYIDIGGIFPPMLIDRHFMRSKSARIGSAFHEAFKQSTETSKVFQAIMSSCKAAIYKSAIHGASKEWKDYKHEDPTRLTFYHPIVVIDGPLFEAYLDSSNKIELAESDWIPVSYPYSSPQYSSNMGLTFHCDIVTFKYFENYISLVDNWISKMNSAFVKYYQDHLEK